MTARRFPDVSAGLLVALARRVDPVCLQAPGRPEILQTRHVDLKGSDRSARLPPPRGISRQAIRRRTAVSIVIVATVGKVIAANPLRQNLWSPRASNHPTTPAGVIDTGLHKRRIMAFRAIPATDVAPRWQRLQSRLIRLRAPSNVQSSQTRRYVADEQYLADQSHGPSRSKQAKS